MGDSNNSTPGFSFAGALTVLFVGLKLTGYIAWSWWWVFAPLWLPITVALGIVAFLALALGVGAVIGAGIAVFK